jgi:transcription antitermination factor NusG
MDFKHWYALFVMSGREDAVKRNIELLLSKRDDVSTAGYFREKTATYSM